MKRAFVTVAMVMGSWLALESTAQAQEIQLTGPLAGAPAVRKLRLHREKRIELAPTVSFTLLDEYMRSILVGPRLTYHLTDWLGIGVWGGLGFQTPTGLADELQLVIEGDPSAPEGSMSRAGRHCESPLNKDATRCKLTLVNMNLEKFSNQLARIEWVAAPQVSFIPFRGKLSLLQLVFVDTDVNVFLGPAFVGVRERKDCKEKCADQFSTFNAGTQGRDPVPSSQWMGSRMAIAPSFGLGLNFYPGEFVGFGVEWRGLPFAWNTAGFDNHGGGPDGEFPDLQIDADDREFKFNSMMTVHVSLQFPFKVKSTE